MNKMKNKILGVGCATLFAIFLAGCNDDAQIASRNLSKAADNFEVDRRIVFYNGWTNTYMLEVVGKCSIEVSSNKMYAICKYGDNDFRKHGLGLSSNITWFSEQLKGIGVNVYHTRITWKPQAILPDVDFRGDIDALKEAVSSDNKD